MICPYCARDDVPAGARFCPFCAHELPPPAGDSIQLTAGTVAPGAQMVGKVEQHHYHYAGPPPSTLFPDYNPPPLPDLTLTGPDTTPKLPDPGPLPPGSRLPFARNALFTGRHHPLHDLAAALLGPPLPLEEGLRVRETATLMSHTLAGMGGIGKTQLAAEFAYRFGRFFHGVHWINARDPALVDAEIASCGRAMRLQPWPEALPDQVTLTLHAWRTGGPRLVVLDNLEDVAAAARWLPQLGPPVRLLLTARRRDFPPELGVSALDLTLFSPEESRAYLRRRLPQVRATEADLDALGERLGQLPLALHLAGRYLAQHPRLPVAEYLTGLTTVLDDSAMLDFRRDLALSEDADLNLAASFLRSWQQVKDQDARRLFLLAGHCAPNEPIPCALLERALRWQPPLTPWQRFRGWFRKPQAADSDLDYSLRLLTDLGLLSVAVEAEPQGAASAASGPTIHPLLAEYARSLRDEAGRSPVLALADALGDLTFEVYQTGLPSSLAPYRAHLETAAPAIEEAHPEAAGRLWNHLGSHLHAIAAYDAARAAFERALAIDEAVCGPDHPNVARDVNNLGLVLQDQGDLPAARDACERALTIWRESYGDDHPQVATAHNNLGSVLQDLGDLLAARDAFERALAIDEAVYGPHHSKVATDVNNLGSVLWDLGDLPAARDAFERALAIEVAVYGADHPNVARVVNNLGNVLAELGDLPAARDAHARALAIDEAVYGPDHPNVARDVNNLGGVLRDLGDLPAARVAFERALSVDEAIYGPHHPEVATDVSNLGTVLWDLGDLPAARAAFARALAIFEATLPAAHPHIQLVRDSLANLP